jgi:hypothetical protein
MSKRFGRYLISDEVTEELGRGAFGRVYRAFDPNINRYVAIKVLSSSSDSEMLVRFQDESKTAGKLEHENIVKVYDFDLQDGVPYLVMELLDGETLEVVIKTQRLAGMPVQLLDKVEIMFQVAKGLEYAHGENVIHRDIKPGNIMVLPNRTVKVMDFGIARVVDKDGTRRTRQGDVAGTVLYMAPEQFGGRDADRQTDIFAYADVFYELLTGQHPFSGTDFATVMYRITTEEPRPIRDTVPECPVGLDNMIQRLLAKDPEIRPDRLDEVILKIQPVLQRLRRERAAVMAADIEPLIQSAAVGRAQVLIGQVLQLDPFNSVAEHWRDQIQQEQERKALRARAAKLVAQGREHLLARRFKEALQSIENALKLEPADPAVLALVEQVRRTYENVQLARRLLSDAHAAMGQGELVQALDATSRAMELDPGNGEIPKLRDQIRCRQEEALLERVESFLQAGNYESALGVLSDGEAAGFSVDRIATVRGRVEKEQAAADQRRRQEVLADGLADGRKALYSHHLEDAERAATTLCTEFPDEPAAEDFRIEVQEHLVARRRLENISRLTEAARNLIKEHKLNDARAMLETGLRTYPRDTGITRLMDIVNSLAKAQERARKISHVIRHSRTIADAGQLDEALQGIIAAIAEFGEETTLLEYKRNYQIERDQREYERGLQDRMQQGRRLLAEKDPAGAVAALEEAMVQYPGELQITTLLNSARSALAELREAEFVSQHRSQVAELEKSEQYSTAVLLLEAALSRYPANSEMQDGLRRLNQKVQERDRNRSFAAHCNYIEEAIKTGDLGGAAERCAQARREFADRAVFDTYAERIREAQRQQELQRLQAEVGACLARQELDSARQLLENSRSQCADDLAWQTLWAQYERLSAYDHDVRLAAETCAAGDPDQAERVLHRWLDDAPDGRIAQVLEAISKARQEAADKARREAEERCREENIARARSEARALCEKDNYQASLDLLNQLAEQYPDHRGIQQDRKSAQQGLEDHRQRVETAVSRCLQDAADFVRQGDPARAIAVLDQLERDYPDRDVQREREAAVEAGERQKRAEEELARRRAADAAISSRRREADALVQQGNYPAALAILEQLESQFPGRPEVQQDREAVQQALDPQHQEAAAALAKVRSDAEAWVRQGHYKRAIQMLSELIRRYPDYPDIQKQRDAAVQAIELQRRREAQDGENR